MAGRSPFMVPGSSSPTRSSGSPACSRSPGIRRTATWITTSAALEAGLIATAATYGVEVARRPPYTGVWSGERKLGAIGVKLAGGVTTHGVALNVATDLSWFDRVTPCGIEGAGVASLASLGAPGHTPEEVALVLAQCLADGFWSSSRGGGSARTIAPLRQTRDERGLSPTAHAAAAAAQRFLSIVTAWSQVPGAARWLHGGIPRQPKETTRMTHLTALRNSVLCGFAVVAVAGCGAAHLTSAAAPPATTPSSASAVAATPSPATTPDTSGINQQVGSIDNQLSTINGQLNAANAGLNSSEGNPAQ